MRMRETENKNNSSQEMRWPVAFIFVMVSFIMTIISFACEFRIPSSLFAISTIIWGIVFVIKVNKAYK